VLGEKERLDLIDSLTDNAASLDASILHFVDAARLESGHVVLTPECVELQAVVDSAVAGRAHALAGHNIQTELDVPSVWVDREALERILEHLLINAARSSPIGSSIIVRTISGPTEVVIKVTDRGQGMAPHVQATAWEPLQRGDVSETGISRGAGLGLPIVRELARLHGGDATLASVRGRGTTVSVSLPQPPRPVGPAVSPATEPTPVAARR
jgi:signal transduction histidine kinase